MLDAITICVTLNSRSIKYAVKLKNCYDCARTSTCHTSRKYNMSLNVIFFDFLNHFKIYSWNYVVWRVGTVWQIIRRETTNKQCSKTRSSYNIYSFIAKCNHFSNWGCGVNRLQKTRNSHVHISFTTTHEGNYAHISKYFCV